MIALALAAALEVFPSRGVVGDGARSTATVAGYPVEAAAGGWLGTFGGGLRDAATGARLPGSPDVVTQVRQTPEGLLFGGPRGLFRLQAGAAVPVGEPGLPDGHVVALAKGGGALWVATFDGGLSAYSSGTWRSWSEADGLPSDWLDDVAWDGAKLWAVGDRGVFWVVDGKIVRPEAPALRRPGSALFFYKGAMHVAQAGAVLRLRGERVETLRLPEKHPQDLWVDERGVWVAGLEGLYRDGKKVRAGWITAVHGRVFGTYDQGLHELGGSALLPEAWINLKALDADGDRLAAGGMEEGLWLREGGLWRRLRRRDGLPGDDVSAVLFDGDALWIGTRTGLARLSLVTPPSSETARISP